MRHCFFFLFVLKYRGVIFSKWLWVLDCRGAAVRGRQGSHCEEKNGLTMDFGYIHGKRAHFRVVIVAVSDFQELNDRYWGANNYKGKLGQRQNFLSLDIKNG